MDRVSRLLLVVLLAGTMLAGADDCPLQVGTGTTPVPAGDGGTGDLKNTVDIGGAAGAYWTVTFSAGVVVTARTTTKVDTQQATTTGSAVTVLDSMVYVAGVCQRTDALCPHQVLPSPLAIIQTGGAPAKPYVGFNRKGPLEVRKKDVALVGSLTGYQLDVPLETASLDAAKGQACALQTGSAIRATAGGMSTSTTGGASNKATSLQGTLTLVYKGECINLGAGSAVQPGTTVELSASFVASRKP